MTLLRGVLLWCAVGLATALAPAALRPELSGLVATRVDLAVALRAGAAIGLLACLAWWWVASSLVLVAVARGRLARPTGCPRWLHRAVIGSLGLGLTAGLAGPAAADPGPAPRPLVSGTAPVLAVQGLPYPDRATLPLQQPAPTAPGPTSPPSPDDARWVVRPGDSLWEIAARDLPAPSSAARIEARWREIYRANRRAIGADPDVIVPGTVLVLPRHTPDTEEGR